MITSLNYYYYYLLCFTTVVAGYRWAIQVLILIMISAYDRAFKKKHSLINKHPVCFCVYLFTFFIHYSDLTVILASYIFYHLSVTYIIDRNVLVILLCVINLSALSIAWKKIWNKSIENMENNTYSIILLAEFQRNSIVITGISIYFNIYTYKIGCELLLIKNFTGCERRMHLLMWICF